MLVTVMLRAVTFLGTVGAVGRVVDDVALEGVVIEDPLPDVGAVDEGLLPTTITQSPFARADNVDADVEVKRVDALKSTVVGPLDCWTAALSVVAAITLPDTELNDVEPFELDPLLDSVDVLLFDEPPPHAATRTANAAPPTTVETSRDT